jgi:ParB family chromosome partitioning protein
MVHNGLLQPVVVRPKGADFELVAGERRWRAAQLAQIKVLPAIIRDADEEEVLELALIENLQREDLNAIDRARAYLDLHARFDMSHDEIARRMGETRSNVANYIRLLELDDDTLHLVRDGAISMGHARCLLGVADQKRRAHIVAKIRDDAWSVRQTEWFVQSQNGEPGKGEPTAPQIGPKHAQRDVIHDLERRLTEAVGLRVRIMESRRKNHGRIVVEYNSLDDFERISGVLGLEHSE